MSRDELQALLRKALAAAIGALLGLILLSILLIGGVILLLKGALLGLTPWLGEAGAYGVTGLICLVLLGLFFVRLLRRSSNANASTHDTAQNNSTTSPIQRLRQLIRQNPWEALLIAFTLGFAERSDPHLRKLLLQGGLALFNHTDDEPESGSETTAHNSSPSDPSSAETAKDAT